MTWLDFAKAAGATTEEEADLLLWCGTAFPFASIRTIWYQLRHVIRHRMCLDRADATCAGRKPWRRPHTPERV